MVRKRLLPAAILIPVALSTSGCPLQCEVLAAFFGTWHFEDASLSETITFGSDGSMVDDWEPTPGVPHRIIATWEACWRGSSDQGTLMLTVSYDGVLDDPNAEIDPPEPREWPYQFVNANTVVIMNGRSGGAGLAYEREI